MFRHDSLSALKKEAHSITSPKLSVSIFLWKGCLQMLTKIKKKNLTFCMRTRSFLSFCFYNSYWMHLLEFKYIAKIYNLICFALPPKYCGVPNLMTMHNQDQSPSFRYLRQRIDMYIKNLSVLRNATNWKWMPVLLFVQGLFCLLVFWDFFWFVFKTKHWSKNN